MERVRNFENFQINLILEKVDYEWDLERGIEIDYNNQTVKKLKNSMLKSKNKKGWFNEFIGALKEKKPRVRKNIILAIIPFVLFHTEINEREIVDLIKKNEIGIEKEVKKTIEKKEKNPLDLYPSSEIKKFLKKEEGLSLEAYEIGDGMITIGYGHAEPKSESQFKIGDVITQRKANELFEEDLETAYKGVKRIFEDWNQEGIYVGLTQNQFDALVSLAFNTGVQSVRDSKFIQSIKKKDFKEASQYIKNYNTSSFSGLVLRREKEQEIFNS